MSRTGMKASLSWNDLNTAFFRVIRVIRVIRVFRGSIQRPSAVISSSTNFTE